MGDRRISVSLRRAWDSETGMDQASAGTFSDALSAHQGRGVLARALAECRSNLQQFARELVGRVAPSVSRRCREPRLVREFGPEGAQKNEMIVGRLCQTAVTNGVSQKRPTIFLSPDGQNPAEHDAAEKVIAGIN